MQNLFNNIATKTYTNTNHIGYLINWKLITPLCKKWSLNRDSDQNRVNELVQYYNNGGYVPLFLHLAETEDGLVCYDGNHRREMMNILNYNGICIIDIIFNATKDQLIDAFNNLNKSIQVPLVYLETTNNTIKDDLITLVKSYEEKYKPFVSTSSRCHSPNFNRDTLMDNLYSIYQSFNNSITVQELRILLERLNSEYSKGNLCQPHNSYRSSIIEKCKKYNLWLFINRSISFDHMKILYDTSNVANEIVETNDDNNDNNDKEKSIKKVKKSIPKPVKNMVWNKYVGKEYGIGKCFCCQSDIDSKHFECGHVIAEVLGGETTVDNLRPVCGLCNKSMGTLDMNSFIQKIRKESNVIDIRDIAKEYNFVEKRHKNFINNLFTSEAFNSLNYEHIDFSYMKTHTIYCTIENFNTLMEKYFKGNLEVIKYIKCASGTQNNDYVKIDVNNLVSYLVNNGITVIDANLGKI